MRAEGRPAGFTNNNRRLAIGRMQTRRRSVMRRTIILAAVVALRFAPAPLPKRPARANGPDLQGEWRVVCWEKQLGDGAGLMWLTDGMTVRIGCGRIEIVQCSAPLCNWSLTFDPAGRPPRVNLLDSR